MSKSTLSPAFDFIAAGKQVLALERKGLVQLVNIPTTIFTTAVKRCSAASATCE